MEFKLSTNRALFKLSQQGGVTAQVPPPVQPQQPSMPPQPQAQPQTATQQPQSPFSFLDSIGQEMPITSFKEGDVVVAVVGPIRAHVFVFDEIKQNGSVYGWRAYGRDPSNLEQAIEASRDKFLKWTLRPSDPRLKPRRILHVSDVVKAYKITDLSSQLPSERGGPPYDTTSGFPPPSRPPVEPSRPEIRKAIKESRHIIFQYTSLSGTTSERRVQPLYVFLSKAGKEILLSIDVGRRAYRAFRVENIGTIKQGAVYKFDPKERLKKVDRTLTKMRKEGKTDSLIYEGLLGYRLVLKEIIEEDKKEGKKKDDKSERDKDKSKSKGD